MFHISQWPTKVGSLLLFFADAKYSRAQSFRSDFIAKTFCACTVPMVSPSKVDILVSLRSDLNVHGICWAQKFDGQYRLYAFRKYIARKFTHRTVVQLFMNVSKW